MQLVKSNMELYLTKIDELVSPLFVNRWSRHLSLIILISSAFIFLFVIITVFTHGYGTLRILSASKVTPIHLENNTSQLVAIIPNAHLFGESGMSAKNEALPISSLQIELTGIITANPESLSRVIISEQGKPGKLYQAGDKLGSGIKVYQITEDSVVLENGGQFEKLLLRHPSTVVQGAQSSAIELTQQNQDDEEGP